MLGCATEQASKATPCIANTPFIDYTLKVRTLVTATIAITTSKTENTMNKTPHEDKLHALNTRGSMQQKIEAIYESTRLHAPFINRLAVALYDHESDMLKTFIYAGAEKSPLPHYQFPLKDAFSLSQTKEQDTPRVINDLEAFADSTKPHTIELLKAGYLSSYTLPMFFNGSFLGFVFFNSFEKNIFDERVMTELDMIGHLITLLVYNERSNIRTLLATVKSALDMTHSRDPETGSHLERMSRYARLIARELADKYNFSDNYIEHIYLFSPLHDIGKIKTPDHILLKKDKLSVEEFEVMKKHSADGLQIINSLMENYSLNGVGHVEILRNITEYHHEAIDGSGYPNGLKGDQIPIEARIVTVADIFDALTSERPYKNAWPTEQAIAKLRELAGIKIDAECVEALLRNLSEVKEIMKHFKENEFG